MKKELLQAATEFARIGGKHTLNYFKKDIEILVKSDDSPVTVADRETEKILRELIEVRFPDHGIIGEEFGSVRESADYQWILDPIDGTKSFIHGVPFYTTLIGITYKKQPLVGVIYAPALEEMCAAAIGLGVTLNGVTCKVSEKKDLGEATFLMTDVQRFHSMKQQDLLHELLKETRIQRTWGDAYGHMMVATGRAEIMYDPELNVWDAAALLPVVQEAGGIFCDNKGKETIYSGNGLSVNSALHADTMKLMNKFLK